MLSDQDKAIIASDLGSTFVNRMVNEEATYSEFIHILTVMAHELLLTIAETACVDETEVINIFLGAVRNRHNATKTN